MAVEIGASRAAAIASRPAAVDRGYGGSESDLGQGADCVGIVVEAWDSRVTANREALHARTRHSRSSGRSPRAALKRSSDSCPPSRRRGAGSRRTSSRISSRTAGRISACGPRREFLRSTGGVGPLREVLAIDPQDRRACGHLSRRCHWSAADRQLDSATPAVEVDVEGHYRL